MNSIVLSLLAGFVLNFMPCVLPILLIKIYDIVKYSQTRNNRGNLKIISISTTAGIIFVFSAFSLINILFKHADRTFSFGFHFQNPYFLIATIFLLFLFLLNLLNFFHIGYSTRLINYIQKKYEKSKSLNKGIFIENFITAIFMVLFATPCSLPIIGTVATFSLITESYLFIFYNFLAMGVGMSIPFILIIFYPNLLDFLKNRKNLLMVLHKLVIVLMVLTIAWLLYLLEINLGLKATLALVCFLLFLALQFRVLTKPLHKIITTVFILAMGTILPINIFKDQEAIKISDSLWQDDISFQEIRDYLINGKIVFVKISAKWCMICNLNDLTVFSKLKTMEYLNRDNLIAVNIDATQNNIKAEKFYENPNAISVPKYIVYSQKHPNGCSFSGQLGQKEFVRKFENCL